MHPLELFWLMGGGWCAVKMICTCLGGFLLGGSNAENWGDHRKKNFFINNSDEALIPLKGGHQGLETAFTFWWRGIPENCRITLCIQLIN